MTDGEDTDLDVLAAYLHAPGRGDDVMTLAELDGFLACLAAGPEPIAAGEWLPVLWNGAEPSFGDDAQADAVMRAIASHAGAVAHAVADGSYTPIFDLDDDDTPLPEGWADGFMTGASLRIETWSALFESEEDDTIAYPILALCEDEDGEPLLDLSEKDHAFLIAQSPDLIAQAVIDVADYWKRRSGGGHPMPVRSGPKTGRNDPCPCGSGRKFKKCCGAA